MNGLPSLAQPAEPIADAYTTLLRETRGLKAAEASAREEWLKRQTFERRDEVLFELEILLKGLVCFANPRNHPGPPRKSPTVVQDYRESLGYAQAGMRRIVQLCRTLLGKEERAFVFQRYLEMELPDDGARTRIVSGPSPEASPEEALFALRHGFTSLIEMTGGLLRSERIPFRLFYATLSVAQREVVRSTFFNPLAALEFRPEFDRITNVRLLDLMRHVPGEPARKLVALTFLSLFRMLRYLALLDQISREPRSSGRVFLVLAVLRSDARALTGYLQKHAGNRLQASYEQALFHVHASQIRARYAELLAEAHKLLTIKGTLGGIAANLRLELRRAFEHDLPSADGTATSDGLTRAIANVTANLRPALQNAVLLLGRALGARLDDHGIFDDVAARRSLSLRLRRDVWMFAQIMRAFCAKARVLPSEEDRWSGPSSLQFVREFLVYFEAMGYPLLRAADYPRVDAFVAAMSALDESDLLDPERLSLAMHEATQFQEFLGDLFEQIGMRDELREVPFDRRAAAQALKLYLGD